jgi:nucleotide-binding universal stress UspA family protein/nitrite reductase/ring-hydroxylating ferredoxin subunit
MGYAAILVGTDGSETARVAEGVAMKLAVQAIGRLIVVSAYASDQGRGSSERAVAEARGRVEKGGLHAETHVVSANPASAITELADRLDADLIVVGDVGMGGPRRFRLGGVADQVSHSMPCDLLIVRTSKGDRARPPGDYERVLIATDGSPTADHATRVGAEFARSVGADLTLVDVGEPVTADIILRDTAERLGHPDVPKRVLSGDPGDRIAELAGSEGHDLVVVGNKGMSGSMRFLLGTVPNKVSHLAPCDVLIVNTVGRSLDDLAPGDGAVVIVAGKKVAAFREESGGLVTLSPKCKHLGCTVGWNQRRQTWDCPCHGSRYDPHGNVVNGPTRHPLDRVEIGSSG